MRCMQRSFRQLNKVFLTTVLLLTVLVSQTSTVFAVQDYSTYTFATVDSRTAIPESQNSSAIAMYDYLMSESGIDGINANAVMGIIANASQELDLTYKLIGDADRVGGCLQWTAARYDDLLAYAASTNQAADTMECQMQFLVYENEEMTNYNNSAQHFKYKLPEGVKNVETYLKYNFATPEDAAEAFCWGFERCNFKKSNIIYRLNAAKSLPSLFQKEGVPENGSSSGSVSFQQGWFDEYTEEWGILKKQTDSALILPDGSNALLSSDDKMQINYWAEDITSNEANSSIKIIRGCVTALGIIMMIYCALIYISYWFDRINSFVELNALGLLTLGKLSISSEESTSTFYRSTEKTRFVNHKNVCFIVILGIQLGVILISGKIYFLISAIMGLVSKFIN